MHKLGGHADSWDNSNSWWVRSRVISGDGDDTLLGSEYERGTQRNTGTFVIMGCWPYHSLEFSPAWIWIQHSTSEDELMWGSNSRPSLVLWAWYEAHANRIFAPLVRVIWYSYEWIMCWVWRNESPTISGEVSKWNVLFWMIYGAHYLFGEYLSQIEPDYSHQTFRERVDEAWWCAVFRGVDWRRFCRADEWGELQLACCRRPGRYYFSPGDNPSKLPTQYLPSRLGTSANFSVGNEVSKCSGIKVGWIRLCRGQQRNEYQYQ